MTKPNIQINPAIAMPIGNPQDSTAAPATGRIGMPINDIIEGIREYTAFLFSDGTRSNRIRWESVRLISNNVPTRIANSKKVPIIPTRLNSFMGGTKCVNSMKLGKKSIIWRKMTRESRSFLIFLITFAM